MKLKLQINKKHLFSNTTYYEYIEIEIETFRWYEKHKFEYVPKGLCRYKKLEDNEEIIGLTV